LKINKSVDNYNCTFNKKDDSLLEIMTSNNVNDAKVFTITPSKNTPIINDDYENKLNSIKNKEAEE